MLVGIFIHLALRDAVEFCKLRYMRAVCHILVAQHMVEAHSVPFVSPFEWRAPIHGAFFFSPTLHDVKTTSPFCTFEYIHTHTYSAFALVCGRNQYFFVGVKCVCVCVFVDEIYIV